MSVPSLVLDVHPDGTLTATLDGTVLDPPDGAIAWRRALFAQIVDQATKDRAIPARVTVHESDGSTFTDFIPPRKRTAPAPVSFPDPEKPVKRRRAADPVEVDGGDGFVAGEDVAVALVVSYTDASGTGHVRTLIDPALLSATKAGEVVLLGRVSGTVAVRSLP